MSKGERRRERWHNYVSTFPLARDELGIRRFVAWFQFGGMEHRHVMDSMRLFAQAVMPQFREATAPLAAPSAEHQEKTNGGGYAG